MREDNGISITRSESTSRPQRLNESRRKEEVTSSVGAQAAHTTHNRVKEAETETAIAAGAAHRSPLVVLSAALPHLFASLLYPSCISYSAVAVALVHLSHGHIHRGCQKDIASAQLPNSLRSPRLI